MTNFTTAHQAHAAGRDSKAFPISRGYVKSEIISRTEYTVNRSTHYVMFHEALDSVVIKRSSWRGLSYRTPSSMARYRKSSRYRKGLGLDL